MNQNSNSCKTEVIITTEFVLTGHTNHLGSLFGGTLLSWMDKVAALAGQAFCEGNVVTASTEAVDFHKPISLGDVVEIRAWVVATFSHSMTTKISVRCRPSTGGPWTVATCGYFNLVAVDEQRKPIKVPNLIIENEQQKEDLLYAQQLRNRVKKLRQPR